ncbi:lipoprotein-releasing ABC transporter permease subunit [Paremcibacter congregatus]|uniref:Lipoprotein-releasing system transmembrane subunit LolC n=1 Tax=Paremcibacter congregatus TaxID=2043170 RepID=A0A2G4YSL7_9PROT|nr:lipoprotein-releasing ABC transporter permease subunit [Paremcibacter congregatus]PHZ85332.1 lipoprotein-releasing system transmembrane subunit LolC [Paremcibacter congregatus]QDE27737.1 lipoprotein-releasing ABC transporter permease subunit [Paremcibacter congregatus]
MFRAHEWMVAFRYLKVRSNEGFVTLVALFSLLGIAIGVMVLIVTMSVMNGFREELLSKVIGFNGHMLYQPVGGRMNDYDDAVAHLKKVDHVVKVLPIVEGHALATFGSYSVPALVRGVKPEDIRHMPLIADNIKVGDLNDFGTGDNDILIGKRLADKYGLSPGDLVTLVTPRGRVTPFGTVPRIANYQIRAIFEVGEYNYDTGYFFLPLKAAQSYFQYDDQVAALEISLTHPDMITELYPVVQQAMREISPGGRLVDWRVLNQSFFNALQVERNVMFIILSFIILVAVFNIISTMIMMVKNKTRDVAILRTMGVTSASIMRIFFIVGSCIGMVGTLLGTICGLAIAYNVQEILNFIERMTGLSLWEGEVRFLSEVPAIVEPTEVTIVILVSLGMSFFATLLPAWRAAKVDPVKSLRYE